MYYTVHDHSLTGQIGAWQLQYINADVLLRAGYLSTTTHKRRLAQLHVDQAYDEFILQGNYRAFWSHVLSGLWRNPTRLKDLGLIKLMATSLLPWRDRYRKKLLVDWQAAEAAQLAEASVAYPQAEASLPIGGTLRA